MKTILMHRRKLRGDPRPDGGDGEPPVVVPPDPPPSGSTQTHHYTPDTTTDFLNPERGFHADISDSSGFASIRSGVMYDGVSVPMTLTRYLARLDAFKASAISSAWLSAHANIFQAARDAGIKLDLRYAYSYNPPTNPPDAPADRIIQHIGQLAPVWQANADVINGLQAGFVGRWGEWNASGYGITSGTNPTTRNAIIRALLDALPPGRMIYLRYPEMMAEFFGGSHSAPPPPITAAEAFTNTDKARLGILNDSFLANLTDGGTYVTNRYTADYSTNYVTMAYWEATSKYIGASGETVDLDWREGNRESGPAAIADMVRFNWDVLNRAYSTRVINGWRASGHYNEISRRLGYRFVLLSSTLSVSAEPGRGLAVELVIRNDGFGKAYNQRPIDLILTASGKPTVTIRLTSDARRLLPLGGQTQTLTFVPTLPLGTALGNYAAYLALPDPAPSLENDPRYSIRLANTGMWDGSTGRHNLNATVAVVSAVEPPEPVGTLIGVGSSSTSEVDYPRTPPTTTGDWYVDGGAGNDSNNGTSMATAFRTITKALGVVQDGQTILVRGQFNLTSPISRSQAWSTGIRVMAYSNEVPLLNASGVGSGTQAALLFQPGSARERWVGFEVVNAADYGVRIQGDYITLERCYVHHSATNEYGAGIIINSGNNNLLQDCATFYLGTPGMGGTNTPDGVAVTAYPPEAYVTNNKIVRHMAANCTDDGLDAFRGRFTEMIDCVAIASGYYYNGAAAGEGHGFKMGGGSGASSNSARGSIALRCKRVGLNSNSSHNITYSYCTSVHNNVGLDFKAGASSAHATANIVLFNNQETDWLSSVPSANLVANSWQTGVTTSNVRFADPTNGDFSLVPASAARGAGPGGTNLGASSVALTILKRWWNHSKIYIPGRGLGPGGTGLPGDS